MTETILVIDDQHELRQATVRVLEKAGYAVSAGYCRPGGLRDGAEKDD